MEVNLVSVARIMQNFHNEHNRAKTLKIPLPSPFKAIYTSNNCSLVPRPPPPTSPFATPENKGAGRKSGMAEWRNSGMAEWRNGGIAEWRNGHYTNI